MNNLLWVLVIGGIAFFLLRSRGTSGSNLKALADRNAQRVDVRTTAEYQGGHAPKTVNIPLDQLNSRLKELDPSRPVLVCCASGARSAMAASLLKKKGFEAINVGPWNRLMEIS